MELKFPVLSEQPPTPGIQSVDEGDWLRGRAAHRQSSNALRSQDACPTTEGRHGTYTKVRSKTRCDTENSRPKKGQSVH